MRRMKAITVKGNWRESQIDGCCRFALPVLRCAGCKARQADDSASLPALQVPPDLESICADSTKEITVKEFEQLKLRLAEFNHSHVTIMPASQVGPFTGTALVGQDHDFLFAGPSAPLLRRSAADKLEKLGIPTTLGPASLQRDNTTCEDYGAIQAEAHPLLSTETCEEFTFTRCPTCGFLSKRKTGARPKGPWKLIKANWPQGAHLARILEYTTYIVVTPEFVAAVERLGLTGILFEEFGEFV